MYSTTRHLTLVHKYRKNQHIKIYCDTPLLHFRSAVKRSRNTSWCRAVSRPGLWRCSETAGCCCRDGVDSQITKFETKGRRVAAAASLNQPAGGFLSCTFVLNRTKMKLLKPSWVSHNGELLESVGPSSAFVVGG